MAQRLFPGDVITGIPSQTWNQFCDAAEAYQRTTRNQEQRLLSSGFATGIVTVRNDSGADRDRFSVLGIDTTILYTPTDNLDDFKALGPVLKGISPTSTETEKFVVLQEPILNGKLGRGMLMGMTAVQIDVVDATDDYADIISADMAKLRSQPYGNAKIVYKESGTGTKWAFVLLGIPGSQLLIGKTNASHAKAASGTINIYRGSTKGSESFTSSLTVTAWNHYGDVSSGKWVMCAYVQRGWEIISAEC